MNKDDVGRTGEALARQYLLARGYQILATNWRPAIQQGRSSGERSNKGELDMVALDGNTLVGVEVKTRSSLKFGHPAAAITPAKVARLRRLVGLWLIENKGKYSHFGEIRLDAIAIVLPPNITGSAITRSAPTNGAANTIDMPAEYKPDITHYRGISE